jgi:hypothetical protein
MKADAVDWAFLFHKKTTGNNARRSSSALPAIVVCIPAGPSGASFGLFKIKIAGTRWRSVRPTKQLRIANRPEVLEGSQVNRAVGDGG